MAFWQNPTSCTNPACASREAALLESLTAMKQQLVESLANQAQLFNEVEAIAQVASTIDSQGPKP